jgi:hypothetical protein
MQGHEADELDRWISGREPPGPDVKPLADLAVKLRASLGPASPPASTPARVWASLEPQLVPTSKGWGPSWILRPAAVLASVMLVLLLATGTTAAYAAEGSLPGDALYPVKRGIETARLALSLTSEGDADLQAAFADRRLAELEELTGMGRWEDAAIAMESYARAIDGLVSEEEGEGDQLQARLRHHIEVLERVRERAPASAVPGLTTALERAAQGLEKIGKGRGNDPEWVPPGQDDKSGEGEQTENGKDPRGKKDDPPGRRTPPAWRGTPVPTP